MLSKKAFRLPSGLEDVAEANAEAAARDRVSRKRAADPECFIAGLPGSGDRRRMQGRLKDWITGTRRVPAHGMEDTR